MQQLSAENAYLLPKATSEISNVWVLNKYWVRIQVVLIDVLQAKLHDGMVQVEVKTYCHVLYRTQPSRKYFNS